MITYLLGRVETFITCIASVCGRCSQTPVCILEAHYDVTLIFGVELSLAYVCHVSKKKKLFSQTIASFRFDDSKMVGIPISYICACVKFVIRRFSQNSSSCKGPDNCHGENATFVYCHRSHSSCKSKVPY